MNLAKENPRKRRRYNGPERRKRARADEEIPVLYEESGEIKDSVTENISAAGFSFETEVFVQPSSILEVQINKPIDTGLNAVLPIHAKARTVWIRQSKTGKYRLGLEFIDINEQDRDEIGKNVQKKLREGSG